MKRRKGKNREIELGGQDSFLDLVSNIVGILIILVMVAGIRAQYSSANVPQSVATPQELADSDAQQKELDEKEKITASLRQNIEDVKAQSQTITEQIIRQSSEYALLFDLMTSIRAGIEMAAEEKSQTLKDKIEYQRQLLATNAQLEQLDQSKQFFQQARPQATVLENKPTPLAQTVNDKEMHVRLMGGHIVYVPFTELMNLLQRHVSEEQERYFQRPSVVGKVGPVEHFELGFLLHTSQVSMNGALGTRMSLQYAEMLPQQEPLGQPLREALASPQSEFRRKLALFGRDIYTVTVWVYPDSFEEFQELKQFLNEQGYSLAARPLTMGKPIAASPYGTKSSAQ